MSPRDHLAFCSFPNMKFKDGTNTSTCNLIFTKWLHWDTTTEAAVGGIEKCVRDMLARIASQDENTLNKCPPRSSPIKGAMKGNYKYGSSRDCYTPIIGETNVITNAKRKKSNRDSTKENRWTQRRLSLHFATISLRCIMFDSRQPEPPPRNATVVGPWAPFDQVTWMQTWS